MFRLRKQKFPVSQWDKMFAETRQDFTWSLESSLEPAPVFLLSLISKNHRQQLCWLHYLKTSNVKIKFKQANMTNNLWSCSGMNYLLVCIHTPAARAWFQFLLLHIRLCVRLSLRKLLCNWSWQNFGQVMKRRICHFLSTDYLHHHFSLRLFFCLQHDCILAVTLWPPTVKLGCLLHFIEASGIVAQFRILKKKTLTFCLDCSRQFVRQRTCFQSPR